MRPLLQQHSFLVAAVLLLTAAAFMLLGAGLRPRRIARLLVVAAGLAGFFVVFRTGPSSVVSAVAVDDVIRGERPVLVEVYSDF